MGLGRKNYSLCEQFFLNAHLVIVEKIQKLSKNVKICEKKSFSSLQNPPSRDGSEHEVRAKRS